MAEIEARSVIYIREDTERQCHKIRRETNLLFTQIANMHLLYFRKRLFVHGDKMKSLSVRSNKSVRLILWIKSAEDQAGWRKKWYVFTVTVTYINLHHHSPNDKFILWAEGLVKLDFLMICALPHPRPVLPLPPPWAAPWGALPSCCRAISQSQGCAPACLAGTFS